MRRSTTRTAAAATSLALALTGAACGPDDEPPTSPVETDDPVVVDPNQDIGGTVLPETPAEVEPGTDG